MEKPRRKIVEGEETWASPSLRSLRGLRRIFGPDQGESKARSIRNIRDLYRYRKASQWLFDLVARTFLNFGNWSTSVGSGIIEGFRAFQKGREKFREESRLRPPIHITEAQARKDLSQQLASGQVRWED